MHKPIVPKPTKPIVAIKDYSNSSLSVIFELILYKEV